MTITTDYSKSKELMQDFHRVVAQAVRRGRVLAQRIFYGVFGLLGTAAALLLFPLEGYAPIALAGLLVGVFFLVRCVFYYQYLGFFSARLVAKQVQSVQYTFGDDGVAIDDALEHCVHPYHVFQGVYESHRTIVLLLTNRVGYLIAKEDLSDGELTALRVLIGERFETPLVTYDF